MTKTRSVQTVVWSLVDWVKNLIEKKGPGLSDSDMVTGRLILRCVLCTRIVRFSENYPTDKESIQYSQIGTMKNYIYSNKFKTFQFLRFFSNLPTWISPQKFHSSSSLRAQTMVETNLVK